MLHAPDALRAARGKKSVVVILRHLRELRVVRDRFARQVVEKASAGGELFGDVSNELLVPALGVHARAALGVLGDAGRVRTSRRLPVRSGRLTSSSDGTAAASPRR
jgi:hypothetical protein